jgi:DNA modification methylase
LITHTFSDGSLAIRGDAADPAVIAAATQNPIALVVTDPPYGGITKEEWDVLDPKELATTLQHYSSAALRGAAFYVWGGVGKVGHRPFFDFIRECEERTPLRMLDLITWAKKRAYGTPHKYLFTREECAYFCNADRPRLFNIPLLDTKRPYAGYNKKYPAKSEFYRRTNVWTDITEILRGKTHPTEKPVKLFEIPILAHTNPGEWVVDMFAGSGTAAVAARKHGRRFVVIERNPGIYENMLHRLREC